METGTLRVQACEETQGEEAIYMPRMPAGTRTWETDLEQTPPVPSMEQGHAHPLVLDSLASRTVRAIFVVLSHPASYALLSQP